MSGTPPKQPFHRWPDRPFWRVMAPLLVLVWLAAMFFHFHAAGRVSLLDIGDALFVLFVNFAICLAGRDALKTRRGL